MVETVLFGDHVELCVREALSIEDVGRSVRDGLCAAREAGHSRVLVDLSRLQGFASPASHERFFAIRAWAVAAGGALRLALLVRPDWVDPNRFGVTVAANHGLAALPFVDRAAALAWLTGPSPPS